MSTITTKTITPVPKDNMMDRDREQAHLLHEPTHIWGSIDPMSRHDIFIDRELHPHVDTDKLTIYFDNETTRKEYLDMPLDHPLARFPRTFGEPEVESDVGG